MTEPSLRHIAVLIPARDEELLLPRCLRSVQSARRQLPAGVTSDVIVVSDCSQDMTADVARGILGESGLVVTSTFGVVGAARAFAAQLALERFSGPRSRAWLANTDADCEVPESWLRDQLAISVRGFAAVAGIVDVDSFAEHHPSVKERFRLTYMINPDGTHPHVHGANIGVRADAYLQAGGWPNLATAEDHDLWNRLQHSGFPRVSDASLQVLTSGRRVGRAPSGFAGALAMHNPMADS